ncbi:hypothetical protein [Nostoc sp. NMS8]|nr:hypothetical protein [Nostoc sp. NMS8]MBN3958728.1 hypothetical protein [Nostoc sp. NMS8]
MTCKPAFATCKPAFATRKPAFATRKPAFGKSALVEKLMPIYPLVV